MKDASDSPSPPPSSRIKKRLVIPGVLISLVVVLLVWGGVRGNLTDAEPRNPSSVADDVVTQLLRTADGRKQIHAALIVNGAPERVWNVVTNYDHFSEVFPNIAESKGVEDPDGRRHLTGEVRTIVGRWPMDVHVRHEESAGKFIASWDEPRGKWKVNRGSWVVTQHRKGETLLEYNLELKISPFPEFVVRAVLLDHLKPVLRAVAKRVRQEQAHS